MRGTGTREGDVAGNLGRRVWHQTGAWVISYCTVVFFLRIELPRRAINTKVCQLVTVVSIYRQCASSHFVNNRCKLGTESK
jgi:hypothetical protein